MMDMQERPLTEGEQDEFRTRANNGLTNLGLAGTEPEPKAAVQGVETFVEKWQAERRSPLKTLFRRGPDAVDVALALGAVWGDQLVRQFGWEWTCLQADGQDLYAVVSPDRSLAVYPTYFIKACLDEPNADCTAMLAFNMLEAGNVGGLPAGGYENLMAGVRRIIPKR
jgi:hypothetical protein